MQHSRKDLRFLASPDKGAVSALLVRPSDATHLLVLGHGASTNMRHTTLQTIAEALAEAGIATLRYKFPYAEHGTGRDSQAVCTATVRAAVDAARDAAPDLPLLAGGHSFGGRMTSAAAAEAPITGVRGLVFFAFPLHQPGEPSTARAEHLDRVAAPMLFLSGTRDALAEPGLLQSVCSGLGVRATLCFLDTADHGYRVLKRSRHSTEDVFVEMARLLQEMQVRGWLPNPLPARTVRADFPHTALHQVCPSGQEKAVARSPQHSRSREARHRRYGARLPGSAAAAHGLASSRRRQPRCLRTVPASGVPRSGSPSAPTPKAASFGS